ncbi:MAG TPA: CBS domain-containing protein [Pseudonocardiaceae bacterium]
MTATQEIETCFPGASRGARTAAGPVPSVRPEASAGHVARLMVDRQIRSVTVVDGSGRAVGTVAMRDLLAPSPADPIYAGRSRRRWWAIADDLTAADVMTPASAVVHQLFPAETARRDPGRIAAAGG